LELVRTAYRMKLWLVAAAVGVALLSACGDDGGATATAPSSAASPTNQPQNGGTVKKTYNAAPAMTIDANKKYEAVVDTNKGKITLELFAKEAPVTVNNFVFLAREGFYNDVVFHRVIKGFMVQSGDPLGTGFGGPGYRFQDEPVTRDYSRGIIAMANSGRNTNGSQFFIMHQNAGLPKSYNIFGIVKEGLDTVDAIANVPVGLNDTGQERSKPLEQVFIKTVTITES